MMSLEKHTWGESHQLNPLWQSVAIVMFLLSVVCLCLNVVEIGLSALGVYPLG